MNINSLGTLSPCSSCQMCAAVCPTTAINITLDECGFYRPIIDDNKCIDCSLCVKVCCKYDNIKLTSDKELDSIDLLASKAKDIEVLSSTTSGGIAFLLSKELYKQGYKCVGVAYDIEFDNAKHLIADSATDLEKFKGSKYIQSYTYSAFRYMVSNLLYQKVAVFGTPCQIYAIDRLLRLKKKRENFLLIDIYCHGCPSLLLWKKYIDEVRSDQNKKKQFEKVDFRSKVKGWGTFCVTIFSKGEIVFTSHKKKDEFYQLFFSDYLLNDSCAHCKLRSTLKYTDIRLGDFWGKCYDNIVDGMSAVTLVTQKGNTIFQCIKEQVVSRTHKFVDFLPYQSWNRSYIVNETIRNQLFILLRQKTSLSNILKYYYSHQSSKEKAKRQLRNIINLFPPPFFRILKKLYHSLKVLFIL